MHTKRSKIGYYWTTAPAAVGYADSPERAVIEHTENYALAEKGSDGITTPAGVQRVRDEIRRQLGQGVFYALYMVWLSDKTHVTDEELNAII
jgi:hypothetical protein